MKDILAIYTINNKEELELLKINLYKSNDKTCSMIDKSTTLFTYMSNDAVIIWNDVMQTLSVKNIISNTCFVIAICNDISRNIKLKFITLGYLPCMTIKLYLIDYNGTIYCSKSHLIINDAILSKSNKSDFEPIYNVGHDIIRIFQRDTLWYIFYIKLGETYLDIRNNDFKILLYRSQIYHSTIKSCLLYGTSIIFLAENTLYMKHIFDITNTHLLTLPSDVNAICGNLENLLVSGETSYLIKMKELFSNDIDVNIIDFPICNLHYQSIQFLNDLSWNIHPVNIPYVCCEHINKLDIYPSFPKDIEEHFHKKNFLLIDNTHHSTQFQNIHPTQLEIYTRRDIYNRDDLYEIGGVYQCYKRIFHTNQNEIKSWKILEDFIVSDIHNTKNDDNHLENVAIIEIVSSIEGRLSAFIYKNPMSGLVHYVPDNNLLIKHINIANHNSITLYSSISIKGNRDTMWLTKQNINYTSDTITVH